MQMLLADRESQLMNVLWDQGPSTVTEVQSHLGAELAYTTVLTMLRKLEAKGFVGHVEEGRAHRYHALVERQTARDGALKTLVSRLFKGSSDALLMHLISSEKLTPKQIARIKAQLRKATDKEKS
jgi:BlaI family penicillinase repressor